MSSHKLALIGMWILTVALILDVERRRERPTMAQRVRLHSVSIALK
jgi:hypothetical protein